MKVKNREELEQKWSFMKVREHPIGLIIDNMKFGEMDWMIYFPYEDALNRMNQGTVETMVVELIEMMWSVETDYRTLSTLLKINFHKLNNQHDIVVSGIVKKEVVSLLHQVELVLNQNNEYIQVLTVCVCEQPKLNRLQQYLDRLSDEFVIRAEGSSIGIAWGSKKVVVNVAQRHD